MIIFCRIQLHGRHLRDIWCLCQKLNLISSIGIVCISSLHIFVRFLVYVVIWLKFRLGDTLFVKISRIVVLLGYLLKLCHIFEEAFYLSRVERLGSLSGRNLKFWLAPLVLPATRTKSLTTSIKNTNYLVFLCKLWLLCWAVDCSSLFIFFGLYDMKVWNISFTTLYLLHLLNFAVATHIGLASSSKLGFVEIVGPSEGRLWVEVCCGWTFVASTVIANSGVKFGSWVLLLESGRVIVGNGAEILLVIRSSENVDTWLIHLILYASSRPHASKSIIICLRSSFIDWEKAWILRGPAIDIIRIGFFTILVKNIELASFLHLTL